MINEPLPSKLLTMIGFCYFFTDKNPIHKSLQKIGVKRITAFIFHINGSIEVCLSDVHDIRGDDGECYDLSSLIFESIPNGHERQMSLPYFTLPSEHRSDK